MLEWIGRKSLSTAMIDVMYVCEGFQVVKARKIAVTSNCKEYDYGVVEQH
jgi:hypothetical protein